MRNDAGTQVYNIPSMPLDICVADSQGGIGYMIERILRNVLNKHGIKKNVISMITLVEIDKDDPAFLEPSKRIGKIYNKEEAERLAKAHNWVFKPSSKTKNGFQRVVSSPTPLEIINKETIQLLVKNGNIVIAAGGGGIPVYRDENNNLRTADAVIDKDMASSLLATNINAHEFYVLTDVSFIYKDFGLPTQEKLEFLNYADTIKYLENNTFAEGTMRPKINACLNFIKNGGEKSVITEAKKLEDKSYGSKLTMEYD
jgi:carbamate kinase